MASPNITLSTDGPLVLLPIRIETVFQTGSKVLQVRIYPDEIHIKTHVPELLADEIEWGNNYLSAQSEADRKTLWHQLAARFGPQRAAWIIRSPEASPPQQTSQRNASWVRAPYTSTLPDKWVFRGYVKDSAGIYQTVFTEEGKKIRDLLETGPTPDSHTLAGDDPMNWMIDFDKAVEVGMAHTIKISDNVLKSGLDRLIVFGVKSELSSGEGSSLKAASSTRLRSTLEGQQYTRGMSFVPQGTPTNNTTQDRSGYTSTDPGYEISYRIECGAKRCKSGDGTNGAVLAKALGLDTALFEHVRFAGEVNSLKPQFSDDTPDAGREQIDARHLNTALWSATWGYYLPQLLADAFQNVDDTVGRIRRHFIDYVRARGPLPALRIGRQPYSLLPVTSLSLWKIPSGETREIDLMAALLADLRKLWSASVAAVPRVGVQDSSSQKERLLEALSLAATSRSYAVRNAFGPQLVTYYWNFLKRYCGPQWWQQQEKMARSLFASLTRLQQALGQSYLAQRYPRLVNFVTAGGAFDLDAPLADVVPASSTAPLSRNYIDWLRVAGNQEIRRRNGFFEKPPIPLLYVLLRYATLREYAAAAFRLSPPAADSQRYEPELININPETSQQTLTVWDQLEKVIGDTNPTPIGVYLDQLLRAASGVKDSLLPEYVEFRESLRWLKDRPTGVLEPLVSETIDLCSHRLDAWITSLATRKLDKLAKENGGLYLGGYGWVEDLRPAGTSSVKSDAGFIHAPSMTHATAAAMLYSAHLSHGAIEGNSSFAVNLPSQRVRQGLRLLEGIRQGQTLGALLGYRFERGLHDRKLDKYISVYRKLAPLSTVPTGTNGETVESIAANNVADGLTLISLWQKGKIPGSETAKDDRDEISAELTSLDGLVDALGDLLIAESAYQTARGNTSRASAALDALGRGDTPPPEIEVVRTPRTSIGLTHRVLIPFRGDLTNPPLWPLSEIHVPARAEGNLNSWVGSLLGGDPSRFVCRYEYVDPLNGASLAAPATLALDIFGLSPLDLLYMMQGSSEALQSELEQRVTYYLMLPAQRNEISPEALVRLTFSRGAWADSSWITFSELLETVTAIRRVVVNARALEPRDLTWPTNSSLAGLNVDELWQRVNGAMTDLDTSVARLQSTLATFNQAFALSGLIPMDAHYLYDVQRLIPAQLFRDSGRGAVSAEQRPFA